MTGIGSFLHYPVEPGSLPDGRERGGVTAVGFTTSPNTPSKSTGSSDAPISRVFSINRSRWGCSSDGGCLRAGMKEHTAVTSLESTEEDGQAPPSTQGNRDEPNGLLDSIPVLPLCNDLETKVGKKQQPVNSSEFQC
jgi:hypothetical protein